MNKLKSVFLQDKIRLLQDDLEIERELRSRVSTIWSFTLLNNNKLPTLALLALPLPIT